MLTEFMGRRSDTETVGKILVELLTERRIRQIDLATRVGVKAEIVKRILEELSERDDDGVQRLPIERTLDGRAVVWSVPDGWFPNGVVFEGEQTRTLLRMLLRLPSTKTRDELVAKVTNAGLSTRTLRRAEETVAAPPVKRASAERADVLQQSAFDRRVVLVQYTKAKVDAVMP